jgi:tripartite-type tricarboxylate transporter receptor subunit TctC
MISRSRQEPAMIARRIVLAAIVAVGLAAPAMAQTYPSKPIRLVVGFAPGGPADVMARLISQHLSHVLGQSVVVDNRPGAGGTIAAKIVAESDPDGHTLLLGNTSTLVISPLIYKNIGYDPAKAFSPIAWLGATSNLLIANPKFPPNTVQELIAYAKANPGKLNYSSAGIGTPPHLIGEMFKMRAGVDIVHIPYKGGGPSGQAVIAGEVQFTFENPAASLPHVEHGSVKALAVTSETRHPRAPNVPTMIESGLPDFVSMSFTGVVGPAGLPPEIVRRLNTVINEAVKSPEISSALVKLAVDARNETPETFGTFLAKERERLAPVIAAAGVKAE